jgi:hypothetical protein
MAFKKEQSADKQLKAVPEVLIDSQELALRKRAWSQYYSKVRRSTACRRFFKMKAAFKSGNMKLFCELHQQNHQALVEDRTMATPPFPDPDIEMVYGRLGRKESYE